MPATSSESGISVEYISVRKFAKMIGVGHTAIVQAMDSGRIVKGVYVHPGNGHRKIIPDIALDEWDNSIDPKFDHSRENGKKRGGGNSNNSKLNEVKLKKDQVILQQHVIKLRQMSGELVEKDKVYKALFEYGKLIRDSLLAIPDRIVDQVVASKSRNAAHTIISHAIEDALRYLSDADKLKFSDEKTE